MKERTLPATSPAGHATQRAGIQSVEVGFSLLQVLGTSPGPLMLRDLAAAAGMSAAKAHRYLVSFQRLQLVTQDPATTRYDLGPAALKLGLASLSRLDSVKLARQRMAPLMEQIGQTLALAVWGNQGPTIVHWEESPQAITVNLRLGDVMPLLSSATGLCFSAFMAQPGGGRTRAGANNSHQSHDRLPPLLRDELARMQKLARTDVPKTMAEVTA
ncbi:MAG: IclR family transcriptional regulator, partial [Polaromonas sp.]